MLIDWFTVLAQALNFLVLVWLLKRFLYHPILNAIDVREKHIASELAEADEKKTQAQEERDKFNDKNEAWDEQRGTLLTEATNAAHAEGDRILEQTRIAADRLRKQQHEALQADVSSLKQAICRQTQNDVFAIARSALNDLASTSLERSIADVFIRRLREMDGATKTKLSNAARTSPDPVVLRSVFDLLPEHQAAIKKALDETFSMDTAIRFETAPALVSGVELSVGGQRVGWTIAGYLASLKTNVELGVPQVQAAASGVVLSMAAPVANRS